MELHQLRYFLAVAKHLHFGKAAQEIPISPSTLSQQIQKLEEELNTKLFERLPRSVHLTPAGEAFMGSAQGIMEGVASAYSVVKPFAATVIKDINIGILAPVGSLRLYKPLKQFVAESASLNFHISEHWSMEILPLLKAGTLDAAIFSTPDYEENMEILPFFEDFAHVILPKNHPLSEQKTITLEQVCKEAFILPSKEHFIHQLLLNACAQSGLSLNVQQTAVHLSTLFNSVADGCGITVAYKVVASPYTHLSLTTRLLLPKLKRKVSLMFSMNSPYRDVFINLYKAVQDDFSTAAI